jgi:hypothetical protein
MFEFGIMKFYRENKFKIMIFGSIFILIALFILKHLSDDNKRRVIRGTMKRYKRANSFVKKIKDEKKIYDRIFSDIYSDSDSSDENIKSNEIKSRRWMPQMSKGEERCKIYLEKALKRPFNKIRPNLLKNKVTGHNLELDLYNEDLRLGVEYNGLQHYKFCPGIHKNFEHFQTQRYRDEMKKMMCKDAGITLIEVPYTEKDIEGFLFKELSIRGFNL